MTIEWLLTDAVLAIGFAGYFYSYHKEWFWGMIFGAWMLGGGAVAAGFVSGVL